MKLQKGFTLVELIVVISILAILTVAGIVALNPLQQFNKAFDGKRLSDLTGISDILEHYYNDAQCYPTSVPFGNSWGTYMKSVPQDPLVNQNAQYVYVPDSGSCPQWSILLAKLSQNATASQCSLPTYCLPQKYNNGQWACKVNGAPPCDITPTPIPTVAISPTPTPNPSKCGGPTIYGTDGSWCCESDGSYNFYEAGYCTDHAKQAPHNRPPGMYAVSSYANGWYDNTWYDTCTTERKGSSSVSGVGETMCGAMRLNGQISVLCNADGGGASYYACSVSTNPNSSCVTNYDSSGKLLGGACSGKENDTDKTPPVINIRLPYQGEVIQSGKEITLAVSVDGNYRDPVRYFVDDQELNCKINNLDGLIDQASWWNKVGNGINDWCDWKIPSTGVGTHHVIKYVSEDIVGNTSTAQTTVVQQ